MLEELVPSWDGEQVVTRYDHPTGTWIFVCIHSTVPRAGRRRDTDEDVRLTGRGARGRHAPLRRDDAEDGRGRCAFGGGKAVLAVPGPLSAPARRELLLRYGELIESLGGTYRTGPDVNTTVADMDVIGERTRHVFCRSEERGGSGDPGPYTARGVFHGIRASVRHAFGSDDLAGRTVLVQGVGDVGARLAEQLADAGASLLLSDVDVTRVAETAARTGGQVVVPEHAIEAECDVYAPCALGGTLSAESIPRLRCRVVAGSANNQLATNEDAERLRSAGILYAPDFVINAGGVIHAWGREALGLSPEQVEERHAGLGDALLAIYARAEAEGITTAEAAERIARSRIA